MLGSGGVEYMSIYNMLLLCILKLCGVYTVCSGTCTCWVVCGIYCVCRCAFYMSLYTSLYNLYNPTL